MITLKCPKGHTRQVPEALAGLTVTCFECTHTWKVPAASGKAKKKQTDQIVDRVMKEMGKKKPADEV